MKNYSLYALILILLGVIIIIISSSVFLSIFIQRERLITAEVETKIHLAKTINEVLYSPLWIYRIGMFPGLDRALITEMAKFESVVYLRIVSVDGSILQSTIEREWGKKIENPEILNKLTTERVVIIEEIFQEEKIKSIIYPGYGERVILVGFSLKEIEKVIKEMILYNVAVSFSGLILSVLFVFVLLRKNIINPLKKITATCEEVRKGNLDVKIDIKSKNEIGKLAVTFNEMIKNLKESRFFLEKSKAVLEVEVDNRTKELKELSEKLEKQVEERTIQLQERIDELEKFHKLTVGRELRIIECKKEIEELKEELKKYKA